ncbi:MAG: ABC transporter permease [Mobilitalea sp.]
MSSIEAVLSKKKVNKWSIIGKYWLLLFMIVICIIFGMITPEFATISNLLGILGSSCTLALAGIGYTCIMSTGEMDYSVGVQVSCGSLIMAVLLSKPNFNSYFLAVLIALVVMALYGALNAFVHIKIGIPAFIATMATSYIVKGIAKGMTNGTWVGKSPNWPDSFNTIGQGYSFGIIPNLVIVLVIAGVAGYIFTEKTKWGRQLYAVGSNPVTSRYLGIRSNRIKLMGFVISAVFACLSGIVRSSIVSGGSAYLGDSVMFECITVLMLGATFIKKGVYNIPGTILASILLPVIANGLTMMGASSTMRDAVQGILLLTSVTMVTIIRRKESTR